MLLPRRCVLFWTWDASMMLGWSSGMALSWWSKANFAAACVSATDLNARGEPSANAGVLCEVNCWPRASVEKQVAIVLMSPFEPSHSRPAHGLPSVRPITPVAKSLWNLRRSNFRSVCSHDTPPHPCPRVGFKNSLPPKPRFLVQVQHPSRIRALAIHSQR
jgi:hypothetical protein